MWDKFRTKNLSVPGSNESEVAESYSEEPRLPLLPLMIYLIKSEIFYLEIWDIVIIQFYQSDISEQSDQQDQSG